MDTSMMGGYGAGVGMMGWSWPAMVLAFVAMLAVGAAIIVGVVWLVRSLSDGTGGGAGLALAHAAGGVATTSRATPATRMPKQGSMLAGRGMLGGGNGMGAGGKMGGAADASSPDAVRALAGRLSLAVDINRQANTVTYHGARVELVMLASPEGAPDMTWEVAGLVNPTVVIPRGSSATVHVFDADAGTPHGWELTATPPPYPAMVMMDVSPAFPGAFAMPVSGATDQRWFGRTVQFTASNAGTFSYLCPVPGHARRKMDGTLVVQ